MSSIPSLRVTSKQALQAYLWSHEKMNSFVKALLYQGFALLVPQPVQDQELQISAAAILSWFGDMDLSVHNVAHEHAQGGLSAWRLHATRGTNRNALQEPNDTIVDKKQLLRGLAQADFVSAANEEYTDPNHYLDKVDAWFTNSRCTIVENSTGVEYFAQFREDLWMMVSIGLQSASDRGKVTLRQFVYEGMDINPEVLHDHIGFADSNGVQKLRNFLHDTICVLAGPNMSLIHDVYLESFHGARYIRIELCREKKDAVFEDGDLSYITRNPPGFSKLPKCNMKVAAEAMRTVFDDRHEQNMGNLFNNDSVSIAIYKEYDIAKAVRVVPHAFAANRRRYAGIVSQRRLVVPTAETAKYHHVKPTTRIHSVNMEGVPVNHEWSVLLGITISSFLVSGVAAYGVSRDSRVTAADILTVAVTLLALLMISLPQLYVSLDGGDYTVGEFYRGCVPVSACLRRYDVAFLKECVRSGVDVEKFVSGRHACFLMLEARGTLKIGPVQIRDLDDRWDYGVNANGDMCMRYRNKVGKMQLNVKECKETGRTLKWWHCAVLDGGIKKTMHTEEIIKELGEGEVG